jgi:hypothetical protein
MRGDTCIEDVKEKGKKKRHDGLMKEAIRSVEQQEWLPGRLLLVQSCAVTSSCLIE